MSSSGPDGRPSPEAGGVAAHGRIVRGDGVDLAVYERGSGPTVLLVHGYPDTHAVWDGVAGLLANHYHVVTYDVRGSGGSSRPRGTGAYRFERLVADMGAVLDAVGATSPVHLAGHDWGSIQSWEAVCAMPERFASFTSISGPCLDHAGRWTRAGLRRRSDLPAVLRQALCSWYIAAFHVPALPELVWRRGLARHWGRLLERSEGVPASGAHPAPTLGRDALAGLGLYRANMRGRRRAPGERRTDVPTQIVVATGDAFVTPRLAAEAARPFATDLRIRTVDAPHWVPLTEPDTIADMIADQIERVGRRGAGSEPQGL